MERPGLLRALKWSCLVLVFVVIVVFGTLGYNLTPPYYAGMAGALVPLGAYIAVRRALRAAEIRARARIRWGASGKMTERPAAKDDLAARERYLGWIAEPGVATVDPRTWTDLSMEEVYRDMDICFTDAGRNELYTLLHAPLPTAETVRARDELVAALAGDTALRERLLAELSHVGQERDADPAVFLWGQRAARDRMAPLFITLGVGAVVSIVVIPFAPTLGLVLVAAVFITNMLLYYGKARHLSSLIPPLRVLSRMMNAAARLAHYSPAVPGLDTEELKKRTAVVPRLRRSFRWLLTGAPGATQTMSGDIFETIFLYLKIYFAVDLIAFDRITSVLLKDPDTVRVLYRIVGRIDAVAALASYRVYRDDLRPPTLVAGEGLAAQGVYHPQLAKPVANTVTMPRPGAVITGTNMAGKSTFLRTLGVNALLAQTTGACFARSWKSDRFLVMSSIEKHDDPAAGKSFYYDEAERIFGMIESVAGGTPVLLLIDELLSGTNSLERASASVAILRFLARRNALTVAATHDIAIASRLEGLYPPYYFTDRADENGLSFDYKLRPGIVQTRNAIKLLSMIGYPDDVVAEAMREADAGTGGPRGPAGATG